MSKDSPAKKQRFVLTLYNAVGRAAQALGRKTVSFRESEDALHEVAIKAVGSDDFGGDSYREGLRVLLAAYDEEARLSPFGRSIVWQQLAGILVNRLRAENAWAENPGILEQEIERPIFILGLPRTGTTALHHLLGQDPGTQQLEYWLAANPAPRPPRDTWETNPAFRKAARDLNLTYYLDPDLKAIHWMTPEGPEECRHLMQQTFTDDTFECNSRIPSYSSWYAAHDMLDCYERHRDLLRLIGSPSPEKRWLLKYPVHMGSLRELLQVYPDACFVQTHRDPSQVLPSICSLVAGWRAIYETEIDAHAIAKWQLELWASRLEEGMAVRNEQPAERFFDLPFEDVVSDPVGAARRMYAHFKMELSDEAAERIGSYRAENPKGKFGEHRYSAEQFGLTRSMMVDRFAAYTEHFGVEVAGA